ncbi:DMT family transporter [Patescibacteria group bacterium]|nr:DMT family transporter [Patescibacteria group bacterium]
MPFLKSNKKHKKTPAITARAHRAFLGATLIWAAAGPVIKLTLTHIPPTSFLFYRFLIVCIVVLPYAIIELSKTKIHKKDLFNLFILGIFSQTAIWIAFWALKYTSALDYTIISLSGVILSIYGGHYFFKDKLNNKVVTGLILATLGTLLVVVEPILNPHGESLPITYRLFGNVIAVVFNLTWVAYILISKLAMGEESRILKKYLQNINWKPMRREYSPTLIVTLSFYVGLITLIPLFLLEQCGLFGNVSFDIFAIDTVSLFGLLYMALLSSIVAYMLYQWGLDNAHVSESAIYGYLSPVFTLPFAYILLGEVPNLYMIAGTILIATGVVIAEKESA